MTSYFYNGAKKYFFEILSTLAPYNVQDIKTELKMQVGKSALESYFKNRPKKLFKILVIFGAVV